MQAGFYWSQAVYVEEIDSLIALQLERRADEFKVEGLVVHPAVDPFEFSKKLDAYI